MGARDPWSPSQHDTGVHAVAKGYIGISVIAAMGMEVVTNNESKDVTLKVMHL